MSRAVSVPETMTTITQETTMNTRHDYDTRDAYRLLALLALGVALLGSGCGDSAQADSLGSPLCEARCANGDACPGIEAQFDCVSECEEALAQADALGGTCPQAMEDVFVCQSNLSCRDIESRLLSPNHVDECTSFERAVQFCEPAPAASPTPTPTNSEPLLACEAFCDSAEACGVEFREDCVQVCASGYPEYEAQSAACGQTFVDAFDCYSNLTCGELLDRINEVGRVDSCTAIDDWTITICN
ncbi:MAG: hypothetical protein AAF436_09550 [Myxococcota bacterium]